MGVDALGMRDPSLGRILRPVARIALAALVITFAVACPAAAQTACPGADSSTANVRQMQKAMLCLHNVERRKHGLSKLHWNPVLASVAAKHARDMVSRHYFAHVSPGGRDHMDRVAASNYKPAVGCWTAGENLFYSNGPSTPRQLLDAWMHSPAHRQNILHGGWQGFGLGVVATSPQGDANGLTVVALFGTRSKQLCG
jgi:uncharacterized protein YkwD